MPDVNNVHLLALLQHTVDHSVDMRLMAIEQMPEICILACDRAPVRVLFEADDGLFEAIVPFQGGVGVLSVDFGEEKRKVALGSGSDVNYVCHAGLRIRGKTPWPAGACPP